MRDPFIQPSSIDAKRTHGLILWDHKFDREVHKEKDVQYGVEVYTFGGKKFYVKSTSPVLATGSILNAEIMKDVGIMTPPPILLAKKQGLKIQPFIATQDVHSIKDLEFMSAKDLFSQALHDLHISTIKDPWVILKQDSIRSFFLQHMSKDCLDELINAFITTKLCTNPDFTLANYFLYKRPGSKAYEGICAIDLEQSELLLFDKENKGKTNFQDFINHKYKSALLTGGYGHPTSYSEKLANLKNLIQSDKLSESNIRTLRKVIRYDMSGRAAKIKTETPSIVYRRAHDLYSALQEYNRKEILKEL